MAAEYKEISPNAPAGEQLLNWIDNRFPLTKLYKEHLSEYYAPKNLNFWYFFGSLALLVLVIQIISGIFLVMHYKPDATLNAAGVPVAFASVEYIMREVEWGWLIRYIHSTGASFFFIVVYLHMFRGLIYGSYRKPRELIWLFGCGILLVMMAIAFTGYLLPWGQMSLWGAAVIVNLFAAIPIIGPDLALLIRGDFVVGDATLNRFFSLHVIALPLVLLGLVVAHIIALHEVGSNNPDGIEIKKHKDANGKPLDGIPFHPYYSVHDLMGVGVFLMIFSAVVFFAPSGGGFFLKYTNLIPADPLVTPAHIAPVWYFAPLLLDAARRHHRVHVRARGRRLVGGLHRHLPLWFWHGGQGLGAGWRRGRYAGHAGARRHVLGRGGDGRGGGDPVLLALVRPCARGLDPLPPDLEQVPVWRLCRQLCHHGLLWGVAAVGHQHPLLAVRHLVLPRLFLADAVVEPLG